LLFSSGYVANLSVTSLLVQFGLHVMMDKSVHASIYDGLALKQTGYTRFLHNDLVDLQRKLIKVPAPTAVLTESIFSMSGLQAPLSAMSALLPPKTTHLIVDEAHGFGVIGPEGLGGVRSAGLTQNEVPLRMIPFGKALCGSGAIVAGKAEWIDALLQATRQPVYSTAISPAFAYGLTEVLAIVRQSHERRAHLHDLIAYFRQSAQTTDLRWRDSESPIQQLQLGCPFLAQKYAETLQLNQIRCFPIRQPTVTKQETGLRIILNYQHTTADIDRLFQVLIA
jgi:8-amino-7-oxononanoate synthase